MPRQDSFTQTALYDQVDDSTDTADLGRAPAVFTAVAAVQVEPVLVSVGVGTYLAVVDDSTDTGDLEWAPAIVTAVAAVQAQPVLVSVGVGTDLTVRPDAAVGITPAAVREGGPDCVAEGSAAPSPRALTVQHATAVTVDPVDAPAAVLTIASVSTTTTPAAPTVSSAAQTEAAATTEKLPGPAGRRDQAEGELALEREEHRATVQELQFNLQTKYDTIALLQVRCQG